MRRQPLNLFYNFTPKAVIFKGFRKLYLRNRYRERYRVKQVPLIEFLQPAGPVISNRLSDVAIPALSSGALRRPCRHHWFWH